MLHHAQKAYSHVGRRLKKARRRGIIVRRGWMILPLAAVVAAAIGS
jgi:hypothetical protein